MKEKLASRFYVVAVLFSIIGILIIFQMARIQMVKSGKILVDDRGPLYEIETRTIIPERGNIYDRYGNLLAGNREVFEVGINLLSRRLDPETIASNLSQILDLDYGDVLAAAKMENLAYYPVAHFATGEQIQQLEALQKEYRERPVKNRLGKDDVPPNLDAVEWTARLVRTYPENSLAGNILGFYSFHDIDNPQSFYGIEEKYDTALSGDPVVINMSRNPNQVQTLPDLPPGSSLVLTIDRQVQLAMEDVIDRAVERTQSDSGTLIVLDPETGEVISMASTPRMDLNSYGEQYAETFPDKTPYNRAVSQVLEPGSVFKILTMAAAIDSEKVQPDTPFIDTGSISIGGITIYNWDRGAWGPQTMLGCMQHSLNVCLTWVAQETGPEIFYQHLSDFGIGRKTNIDLAGEIIYPMKVPGDSDWFESSLGTNSFGQGIAVTPIQMASAASALANDGKIMAPHILKAVSENGRQRYIQPVQVSQPISAETARTMTEMLSTSIEVEGSDALVDGYRIAGKTGTGEIATEFGYTTNLTNASFVGWGPSDDPKLLIYVWLEKPKTSPWGSVVASPVFSEAFSKLVVLLNIPPDEIRAQLNRN